MYTFSKTEDESLISSFAAQSGAPYTQLPGWARVKTSWTSQLYVGYRDGQTVLTCLVLSRRLPLCGLLWYAPGGFAGDCSDAALVGAFTEYIRGQMKAAGAFAFVIDPPVPALVDAVPQPGAQAAVDALTGCGWRHNPDNNNYTYQPTMTVMVPLIDAAGAPVTPDGLVKRFEKGVRYSVRVGQGRGLRHASYSYDDVKRDPEVFDRFMDVMGDTSERLEFLRRPREYYMGFLENFAPYAVLDLVWYDRAADRAAAAADAARADELARMAAQETRESIKNKYLREKDELEAKVTAAAARDAEAAEATDEDILYVAAGLTITFGTVAECVFGGTKNVLRNTLRSSHCLNFVRICRSIEQGCKLHDMGRVPHSYMEPDAPEHGLFQFKMSFCSSLYEFIGEYALVLRKGAYFRYYRLMPLVRNYRQRIIRFFKRLFGIKD